MRSTILVLLVVLCAALTPAIATETTADGTAAYKARDYAAAFRILRPLAEQGDAAAQNQIGIMHAFGRGVSVDDAEAVRWYRLSAEQGYASAQYNLGQMYINGRGVSRDYTQAYKWVALALQHWPETELERRTMAEMAHEVAVKALTPEQLAEAQKLVKAWKPKQ